MILIVDDDRSVTASLARLLKQSGLPSTAAGSPEEALESGAALVGSETEVIEQLQRRRERWGLSYVIVGDENIDEFAPVVAKLTGT